MPAFIAQLWQYFRDVANLTVSEFDLENEIWCQKWPDVDQEYKLDLIVTVLSEEIDIVKVQRKILDTLDESIALEMAMENEKVANIISRDSVQILSYKVEPGYRAILNIKDPNSISVMKQKKKAAKNLKKLNTA